MKSNHYKDILQMLIGIFEKYFIGFQEKPKSTIGFKHYPYLRDHPLHSPEIWLKGKRNDDNAEGLWRIYDKLYDFEEFITKHPGGRDWIELTKGTDITEAFESHHISTIPEELLNKYFIRKTDKLRNSPFTFEENGLYKTLKKSIRNEITRVPTKYKIRSKLITDGLLAIFILTALLSVANESYSFGVVSGLFLTVTAIASHNFFHQKDNIRMYYFDLTLMSSRSWRVSHSLSHHIYTNTIYDLEISALEPFYQYLTMKKNYFIRYGSWLYTPIVYSILYFVYFGRTIIQNINDKTWFRIEAHLPFILMIIIKILSAKSIFITIKFFLFIELCSSFLFGLIGLNAGHHHPEVFHDGDENNYPNSIDWGLYQVKAAMDRKETHKSHFWSLISFGDHILHHLFPSVDHGMLIRLYPTVENVLKDFGINIRTETAFEVAKGQFLQLAKVNIKMD